MPSKTNARREVTDAIVQEAIRLRTEGKSWSDVIEATGFNGATLRPHMARSGFKPAQANVAVKLNSASIVAARKAGMPWYAIALALDTPEAKVRALASKADATVVKGRTYVKADKPEPKSKAAKPSPATKTPVKKPAIRKPRAKAASK